MHRIKKKEENNISTMKTPNAEKVTVSNLYQSVIFNPKLAK